MGNLIEITNYDEFKTQLTENINVVVDFYAEWCAPCRALSPVIQSVSEHFANDDVVFIKVDIDKFEKLSTEYRIRSIPTLLFLDGPSGHIKHILSGVQPKESLINSIETVFEI